MCARLLSDMPFVYTFSLPTPRRPSAAGPSHASVLGARACARLRAGLSSLQMLSDDEFLAKFRDCTLPPAEFDHVGHVRAGWLYLAEFPLEVAVERLSDDIRRYAKHLGAEGKFHRTITEALMRLMASHLPAERDLTWQQLIERHPVVVEDARGLLLRFYSEELLASAQARGGYVPPDRRPLPVS
ncbi:MAG: hypothetical protein IPK82_03795 [Polyangiaceae bacterium]|nr:hypothetical protein [Polyangiaceae bacterium]